MIKTLKNAWRQPELKNKLLFTLLIIILYRLGSAIPVPYIPAIDLETQMEMFSGTILEFLSMLSGGALAQGTLLALGVSPYITASIVMQLLTVAIPKLGEKAKQGEEGKKFVNFWTRIITIALSVITATGYALIMVNGGFTTFSSDLKVSTTQSVNIIQVLFGYGDVASQAFPFLTMIFCYCAGAAIVMWLAEKINESGIGNGISIILFANIIAGLPMQVFQLFDTVFPKNADGDRGFSGIGLAISLAIIVGLLFLLLIIVWMSDAERRIPIQYAKRVVGRKMYGGQSTNLPLKVNMTGVMPIIFANSIVVLPATFVELFGATGVKWIDTFIGWIDTGVNADYPFITNMYKNVHRVGSNMLQSLMSFNDKGWPYLIVFFVLLIAFAFFYVAISFDPVEVANNIKNNGGAILGIRPGKPTVDYIKKILNRITLLGALLVSVVACLPIIANIILFWFSGEIDVSVSAMAFSGSSMMIVVGVAIETIRELEAQLSLRNYKGFLD